MIRVIIFCTHCGKEGLTYYAIEDLQHRTYDSKITCDICHKTILWIRGDTAS